MSILAECPVCHKKQAIINKACSCGADMEKLKEEKNKVRYWIEYYVDNKQVRLPVGFSIEEARNAQNRRITKKNEKKIYDILPGTDLTYKELSKWYLILPEVKKMKSYKNLQIALKQFNDVFEFTLVNDITNQDLQRYQKIRFKQGISKETIDMEISIVQAMLKNAFDNDKVDGSALKAFRSTCIKPKIDTNARNRIFSISEYVKLLDKAHNHLRPILITAFNTGMRMGELLALRWAYVDNKKDFIRLPEDVTEEGRAKIIPVNHNVSEVLKRLPRSINHDFIFTFQGKRIHLESDIKNSFKTACKDAGIPYGIETKGGAIFNDIRRTVKINMLNAGVEKEYMDSILGHDIISMDMNKINPAENTLFRAMSKYTDWLDTQIEKSDCTGKQ